MGGGDYKTKNNAAHKNGTPKILGYTINKEHRHSQTKSDKKRCKYLRALS